MQHSKTGQFYTFVISNGQSFISQSLKTAGPLGEKFDFLSPLEFNIQRNYDLETSKIELHFIRTSKWFLNGKHLIHGRKTARIWKFSAQNFQMYFRFWTSVVKVRTDFGGEFVL